MLSRTLMTDPHPGHAERGVTIDTPAGTRWMTTLANEPSTRPQSEEMVTIIIAATSRPPAPPLQGKTRGAHLDLWMGSSMYTLSAAGRADLDLPTIPSHDAVSDLIERTASLTSTHDSGQSIVLRLLVQHGERP